MSLVSRVAARPITWLIVFALLMGLGAYMLTQIPVDQFPDIEMPVIMVRTDYGETAPEIVERNVTRLLEGALASVTNLEELSSTSSTGSSTITLEFTYGTDLAEATDDVRDSLERIRDSLPDGAGSPSIFKFNATSMPILRLAVQGDRSADELYAIAVDSIQARLERIEGVASTSVQGGRERLVRVEIPQDRLEAYGVTLTSVAAALAGQNVQGSGGDVTEGTRSYVVTTAGEFRSLEDIEHTVIAYRGGEAVLLRDLADVEWGHKDADSVVYVNGQPGTYLMVMKQSGSNSIEVADRVRAELEKINRQLPPGVDLHVIMDTTSMIRGTMAQVVSSAYYGIGLTVLVLLLFLRRLSTTLIVAISIPAAILATIIGMYFLDISFNMISLTGIILALGMVVDSSIVVLENIYNYREKGSKLIPAAVLGGREMTVAISASTLTTVCVFLPLVIFQDRLEMIGMLVRDLSFTIVIALMASLAVAVTLVPVLASHTLPVYTSRQRPARHPVVRAIDWALGGAVRLMQEAYRYAIAFVLRARWLTLIVILGLCAAVLTLVPKVGFQFTPASPDDTVQLNVNLPAGTPLEKTEALMQELEAIARQEIVGYSSIVTSAGGGGPFRGSSSGNTGDLVINLTLEAGGDNSWSAQAKLRKRYGDFPDATFTMGQFRGMGGGSEIDVAIYCDDLGRSLETAGRIKKLVQQNLPAATETEVDIDTGLPQVRVVIDRQKAFDLGVSISAATREVEAAMAGTTATVYRSGGDEYDVLLVLDQAGRSEPLDLERIFVAGSNAAERIPLASFAHLEKTTGPVDINRENQRRVVHVTGSLAPGTRADTVEAELRRLIDANIVQDDELSIEYAGSMAELSTTGRELAVIALMALILVYGVMAAQFQSFKDPFIILLTVPLLFIGVVLMYVWTGEPFSIFSGIGIVVLLGIVVNNGIVLVDYTNLLRARGAGVRQACIEAGRSRLRPILMTSLTTICGMVPMAFFGGEGAEQVRPIAVTIIGGLMTSTFITLFLVPVLYSLFNERREKRRRKERVRELEAAAVSVSQR